jgi:hypothetical protein
MQKGNLKKVLTFSRWNVIIPFGCRKIENVKKMEDYGGN